MNYVWKNDWLKLQKIYLKNAVQVCMRTNYDQTLLEQTKIFDPHTYRLVGSAWKTRFCGFGKIKREFSIKFRRELP